MSTVSKTRALTVVTEAYVVAIGAAAVWLWWGPSTGRLWLDTLIADVIATLVVFIFSRAYRNSSFYDAYWSVIPPLMLFYWWARSSPDVDVLRCWLLAIVVVVWAIRLTGNWIYSFPGLHHEDWRYPLLRGRAGRAEFLADLLAIHLIPTLQVFLGMIPAYVAVTRPDPGLRWLMWVAFVIGIGAVALEFFADLQLHRFVAEPEPTPMSPRIAFGGFLHETNTFAPSKAGLDAFIQGGGWPSLARVPTKVHSDSPRAPLTTCRARVHCASGKSVQALS
mgnify:CR=1 FL=1